jgi:hypothetical protein
MNADEAAVYAERQGCNQQLMSYSKVFIPLLPDGSMGEPVVVAGAQGEIASVDNIPPRGLLGLDDNGTKNGLYLSILSSSNRSTGYCSDWDFDGYFLWNTPPPNPDTGSDFLGFTWSGNQALAVTGFGYGYLNGGQYRAFGVEDIVPAEGIVFDFRDWDVPYGYYMRKGWVFQHVRQKTCQGLAGNAVLKYTHTMAGLQFSASVQPGNPGTISVTPTSDQWSFARSANFTY